MRPDISIKLYLSLIQSMLSTSLSVSDPSSYRVRLLDEVQSSFAKDFLSFPQSTQDYVANSELGLTSLKLKAKEAVVLSAHQLHNNGEDNLTKVMMGWPLDSKGTSWLTEVDDHLRELGSRLRLQSLFRVPYVQAKQFVKATSFKQQTTDWQNKEARLGHLTNHQGKSKPCWGLERSLYHIPSEDAISYVRLRNSALLVPLNDLGLCLFCNKPTSVNHLLLDCSSLDKDREFFFEEVQERFPKVIGDLQRLSRDEVAHYLLGKGCSRTTCTEWGALQGLVSKFARKVLRKASPE